MSLPEFNWPRQRLKMLVFNQMLYGIIFILNSITIVQIEPLSSWLYNENKNTKNNYKNLFHLLSSNYHSRPINSLKNNFHPAVSIIEFQKRKTICWTLYINWLIDYSWKRRRRSRKKSIRCCSCGFKLFKNTLLVD